MILYHLTPARHLSSIMIHGLLPAYFSGMNRYGAPLQHVFLTNDPDRIAVEQAGSEWCQREKPVLLEIDTRAMQFEPWKISDSGTYTLSTYEFVTSIVDPHRITNLGPYTYPK